MKKIYGYLLLAAMLLTGCSVSDGSAISQTTEGQTQGEIASSAETTVKEASAAEQTTKATTSIPKHEATAATPAETTVKETSAAEQTIKVTTAAPKPEATVATSTAAASQTSASTTEQQTTDEPETISEYDVPVLHYLDREYLLITVIPEKIYWNELEEFLAEENEPINIAIPAATYYFFKEYDSILLYLDQNDADITFKENEYTYSIAFGGSSSWDIDYMFPIKDGVLTKPEISDEMYDYFGYLGRGCVDDDSYLMEENPNEFYYGMTIDEIDNFMRENRLACVQERDFSTCLTYEMSVTGGFFASVSAELRVRLAT